MQLPDFINSEDLNNLRRKMWVELNSSYNSWVVWNSEITKLNKNGELEKLDFQDVSICFDNTLEYRGKKIVLYVREQQEQWVEWAYKYHFYNCATLKSFKEQWLYNWKFVVNTHWQFKVDKISFWRSIQKNVVAKLNVCKNCLKESNYKDYNNVDYNKKNSIYNNFSRIEYFDFFE